VLVGGSVLLPYYKDESRPHIRTVDDLIRVLLDLPPETSIRGSWESTENPVWGLTYDAEKCVAWLECDQDPPDGPVLR
jgi:hypothetical protein